MQSKHARAKEEVVAGVAVGPNDGCLSTPEPSLRTSMADSEGKPPKDENSTTNPEADSQALGEVVSNGATTTPTSATDKADDQAPSALDGTDSMPMKARRGSSDSAPDEAEPSRTSHKRAPSPTPSSASISTMRRKNTDVVGQIFLGIYPYAGDVGDLSFQKGEEIVVLNSDDGDWCVQPVCRLEGGGGIISRGVYRVWCGLYW